MPFPFLGPNPPAKLEGKLCGYVGYSRLANGWQEGQKDYRFELNAFGWGDPSFAAYYPACRTILGFHDTLDGDVLVVAALKIPASILERHGGEAIPDALPALGRQAAASKEPPASTFLSLLSGWVQQGVESFFATQRVLIDVDPLVRHLIAREKIAHRIALR